MLKQKYWQYSVNELGMMDIEAQIKWIHNVKSDELKSSAHASASVGMFQLPASGAGNDILNGGCVLVLPLFLLDPVRECEAPPRSTEWVVKWYQFYLLPLIAPSLRRHDNSATHRTAQSSLVISLRGL